jgi:hypothetical protein
MPDECTAHLCFPGGRKPKICCDIFSKRGGVRFHIDFAGLNENSTTDEFFRSIRRTIPQNLLVPPLEFETKLKNGKPIEVINIWGPLFENISQHILGFLPPGKHKCAVHSSGIGLTCVESNGPTHTPITLKKNMKRGEVYLFRTSGPNAPPHGSITIQEREDALRRSFELRFIVMQLD